MSSLHLFYRGPFSQWYPASFILDDIYFNCAEQAMMYFKAKHFKDDMLAAKILISTDPEEQKELGRQVCNYNDDEWKQVAKDYVYKANFAKFTQNEDLMYYMLNTENLELVEASPWDTRWGIGLSENDPRALDKTMWKGSNWLGIVLMEVREKIKEDIEKININSVNF